MFLVFYLCMSAHQMPAVSRGGQKALVPLELELWTVVSHHVVSRIEPWSSGKVISSLYHWAISLSPNC